MSPKNAPCRSYYGLMHQCASHGKHTLSFLSLYLNLSLTHTHTFENTTNTPNIFINFVHIFFHAFDHFIDTHMTFLRGIFRFLRFHSYARTRFTYLCHRLSSSSLSFRFPFFFFSLPNGPNET